MALHRHGRAVSVAVVVVALLLCLAVVSAVTSAMAASPSPAGSPSGKVILRLGFPEALDSLNPFVGYSLTAYEVYHLNYDFLVGYKASDLSPAPELATSWSSTPDGKTWTFKVRTGVKWQDGVPFTAKDVAFTYNYIIDNQLSAFLNYVSHIKSVEAINDQTVVFHLTKPKANMLRLWVPIIPEHIWSKISGKAAGFTFQNQPPVIGTGPFQVVENKPGSYVRLVANKQYWRGAPKIDEVILETFTNPISMAAEVQAGQLDGAEDLPPASFEQLSRVPGIKTSAAWLPNLLSLSMNCYDSPDSLGNPVLLDVRFRQALNWAIDKDAIIKTAYFGYADPASTIVCDRLPWHWEPPASIAYGFDLAKASQLLTQAGYKLSPSGARLDKKGKPITLRLMATSDNAEAQSAAMLIAGWFQKIGLKITLSVEDEGTLSRQDLQHGERQDGPRLRPRADVFRRIPRPGCGPELVYLKPDRRLERRLLVQRRVRPAVSATGQRNRPREAQAVGRPDAGDLLSGESGDHASRPKRTRCV